MDLRRAAAGDERIVRSIRLQALADSPEAFWSTFEEEVTRTPAEWKRCITSGVTFLIEDCNDRAVGIVGAHADSNDASAARVVSMWVHPDVRGTGAADALMHEALEWAESRSFTAVRLFVVAGNVAARRLYERHGFRFNGRLIVRDRDGRVELEMERP